MKKRLMTILAVAATALWLGAKPAAAQGQSQNHAQSHGAAAGSHEPMGMDHAMGAGGMNNSTARGPKTPGQLLTQNTQLSSKLQSLLPAGTDLQTAAASFRNLGQFVAAVHVSHNLNIPFACLASDVTGAAAANFAPSGTTVNCPAGTGTKKMSLGGSIQALDPSANKSQANHDAKEAMKQAKNDISNKS